MKEGGDRADEVEVTLAEGAQSGLASIVQQYLEQQIAESAVRRARAARLRGRIGLSATDYGVSVTVDFGPHRISIMDGMRAPLDASIAGPYASLTKLLQGRSNPLVEHLRGRLKVTTTLRNLLLPLRVHALVKLSPGRAR
jgi:predicted lipid carrier protein YhbT